MEEHAPSLVTLIPDHTDATDSHVPACFKFILSNADWKLLIHLGETKGGPIAEFWGAIYEAVTSDEQGNETSWPDPATVEEAPFFRVLIAVEDFKSIDLRPGHFNDYLGETRLIPIVYEMVHWIDPEHFPLETKT